MSSSRHGAPPQSRSAPTSGDRDSMGNRSKTVTRSQISRELAHGHSSRTSLILRFRMSTLDPIEPPSFLIEDFQLREPGSDIDESTRDSGAGNQQGTGKSRWQKARSSSPSFPFNPTVSSSKRDVAARNTRGSSKPPTSSFESKGAANVASASSGGSERGSKSKKNSANKKRRAGRITIEDYESSSSSDLGTCETMGISDNNKKRGFQDERIESPIPSESSRNALLSTNSSTLLASDKKVKAKAKVKETSNYNTDPERLLSEETDNPVARVSNDDVKRSGEESSKNDKEDVDLQCYESTEDDGSDDIDGEPLDDDKNRDIPANVSTLITAGSEGGRNGVDCPSGGVVVSDSASQNDKIDKSSNRGKDAGGETESDGDIDGEPLDSDTSSSSGYGAKALPADDGGDEKKSEKDPEESVPGETRSSSSRASNKHPYMGKRVRIVSGRFHGLSGKIIKVGTRGWWTIDHPKLTGHHIHSRLCEMIDEVEESTLREYYARMGMKMRRTPTVVKRKSQPDGEGSPTRPNRPEGGSTNDASDDGGIGFRARTKLERKRPKRGASSSPTPNTAVAPKQEGQFPRRVRPRRSPYSAPASPTVDTAAARRMSASPTHRYDERSQDSSALVDPDGAVDSRRSVISRGTEDDNFESAANQKLAGSQNKNLRRTLSQSSSVFSFQMEPLIFRRNLSTNSMLSDDAVDDGESLISWSERDASEHRGDLRAPSAVRADSSAAQLARHRQKRPRRVPTISPVLLNAADHSVVPEALRHLPPDSTVEIFNRRTGHVMRGEEAVKVKDLPEELMKHAEYEPVVPAPGSGDGPSPTSREGRSSAHLRVNAQVNPQTRVRASAAEGRHVLVTSGPYRGLTGKVEACIPGGWYLVSELLDDDELELDFVVNSNHLQLLPESETIEHALQGAAAAASSSQTAAPQQSDTAGGSGATARQEDDAMSAFQDLLSRYFSMPIRSLKLRIDALNEEKRVIVKELGIGDEELSPEVVSAAGDALPPVPSDRPNPAVQSKPDDGATGDVARYIIQDVLDEMVLAVERRAARSSVGTAIASSASPKQGKDGGTAQKEGGGRVFNTDGLKLYRMRKRLERVKSGIAEAQRELDERLRSVAAVKDQTAQCLNNLDQPMQF